MNERPRSTPSTPAGSTERASLLAQLLNGLTADERTVLTLRIVMRRSIEETAQQLGRSPAAVRLAQHNALGQLRRELRNRLRRRDEDRSQPRARGDDTSECC